MLILGIESSCDETAAAVVKDGREVLSNVINTQIALHKKFGGVVPEVASRRHIETIDAVIDGALEEANVTFDDIDAIAVHTVRVLSVRCLSEYQRQKHLRLHLTNRLCRYIT